MSVGFEDRGVGTAARDGAVDTDFRGPWLTPLSIMAIYLLFGGLALFVSDVVFPLVLSDPLLTEIQAVKGGVEVVLTAGLIYLLTRRQAQQLGVLRERLERENRELQLLHRVLRHNLRNDVNVILGALERLEEAIPDPPLPEECVRIDAVSKRIGRYTEAARKIRKVNERREERSSFDLRSLVDTGLAGLAEGDRPSAVTVDLPTSMPVRGNHMLPAAIAELLGLAVGRQDYAGRPGAVTIESLEDGPDGAVGLCLRGDGLSIPEADLEALRQGSEDELVHASGMEVWFVVWTIEQSGGSIEWRETDGRPAICLSLPRDE